MGNSYQENYSQQIALEVYKAIRLGKWLYISYKNSDQEVRDFWIAVLDFNPKTRILKVDGMSLKDNSVGELTLIFEKIVSASIIEGTFVEQTGDLIDRINRNPSSYFPTLGDVPVNNILEYYKECYRLDSVPYVADYALIAGIDENLLKMQGQILLSDKQYKELAADFSKNAKYKNQETTFKTIALNALSVKETKGLYVLAYYKLSFCPKKKILKIDKDVIINKDFDIDGSKMTASRYLSPAYMPLFNEFEKNRAEITQRIAKSRFLVDDAPQILALQVKVHLDLVREYASIASLLHEDLLPQPLRAFFGKLKDIKRDKKNYPLIVADRKKVNLDQLLAVHKAMKTPTSYIEGPPGTGKTNTILNIILTAYFNDKTVLITSYNNHPVDGVVAKIGELKYRGRPLYFPIIRLGNNDIVKQTLKDIKELYFRAKRETIFKETLKKSKLHRVEATAALSKCLEDYEKSLELRDTLDEAKKIVTANQGQMQVINKIQLGQIPKLEKNLQAYGTITEEYALSLVAGDEDELFKYIHYSAAERIKLFDDEEYQELLAIILREPKNESEIEDQLKDFNDYLKDDEKLKQFLKIFPIVATTNISAHKLGGPQQHFGMVIMDESSQCNVAVSLVPIIRGQSLVLVGDPQQLNPVIVLDPKSNMLLRQKLRVPDAYDYIQNSIYKVYLNSDPISDATLLKTHYRCDEGIIHFNNKKYYNDKLVIKSGRKSDLALELIDITANESGGRNTSFSEAKRIVQYIHENKQSECDIGVVTPFTNQRDLIKRELEKNNLQDSVSYGTVHEFQGDEKDIILFSCCLTEETGVRTYDWLKNNKELINVATSRAKDKLVMLVSASELERLHAASGVPQDDLYELYQYICARGKCEVSSRAEQTRALGFKPYSTQMEDAFFKNLTHIFTTVGFDSHNCRVGKEIVPATIFKNVNEADGLSFFTKRFDFVVFQKKGIYEKAILAIELDGIEHELDEVKENDKIKEDIALRHGLTLYRVPNLYARQYINIRDNILTEFFKKG
ncbi:MAG: AAA domain-containing protein [Firmicutes bacterium]|nr:AAA domain-containing protein [Bacillota bacterium]